MPEEIVKPLFAKGEKTGSAIKSIGLQNASTKSMVEFPKKGRKKFVAPMAKVDEDESF